MLKPPPAPPYQARGIPSVPLLSSVIRPLSSDVPTSPAPPYQAGRVGGVIRIFQTSARSPHLSRAGLGCCLLSSVLCPLSSDPSNLPVPSFSGGERFRAFCPLNKRGLGSVFCPLSSVFCPLSSVFCPLSAVSSTHWLR